MFVSFMWHLTQHLLGSEQDILSYLGYATTDSLQEDEDEDFDEE
jgi:hypothetical protein